MEVDKIEFERRFLHKFTIESLNDLLVASINRRKNIIVANHNLHSLYLSYQDNEFREFYSKADYIHIDGMGVIYLLKYFFNINVNYRNRITYLDWSSDILKISNKHRLKIFYLGSSEEVLIKASTYIKELYPGINLKFHDGFFNKKDNVTNNDILNSINSNGTNILLVGMSMPIQEKWILENIDKLKCDIILPCGAYFEYLGGKQITPPRFLGKIGLEWLFRLISNPKKLWKRYLYEPLWILFYYLKKRRN